jgi:hypothetical protein
MASGIAMQHLLLDGDGHHRTIGKGTKRAFALVCDEAQQFGSPGNRHDGENKTIRALRGRSGSDTTD